MSPLQLNASTRSSWRSLSPPFHGLRSNSTRVHTTDCVLAACVGPSTDMVSLTLVSCVKCEFLLTSGRGPSFREICSVAVFNDGQVSLWSDLSTLKLVEVLAFSLQMPAVTNPRLATEFVIASI